MGMRVDRAREHIETVCVNCLLGFRESRARVQQAHDFSLPNGDIRMLSLVVGNDLATGNEKIDGVHLLFYLPYSCLRKPDAWTSWTKLKSTKSLGLALAASGRLAAI
jgi:hypothetical protein